MTSGGRSGRGRGRPRPTLLLLLLPLLLTGGCDRSDRAPANLSRDEVADALSGMEIEPGLWELTSEVVEVRAPQLPREARNRMVGPRSRLRHCISAEQAAAPAANFLAGGSDARCAYGAFTVDGGRVTGRMTCPGAEARMEGRYTPEAYEMQMTMESPLPDETVMTVELVSRGRRVGPCPEGEAGG